MIVLYLTDITTHVVTAYKNLAGEGGYEVGMAESVRIAM